MMLATESLAKDVHIKKHVKYWAYPEQAIITTVRIETGRESVLQ